MAASYTVKGDTFVADKPRVWLEKPGSTDFDLFPGGKRVAAVIPAAAAEKPKPDHESGVPAEFLRRAAAASADERQMITQPGAK